LLILNYFNTADPIRSILVLQIAMPAAANGVIFAERYEGNYVFAAESLFFSTLMAALSIPVISYLTTYFK
ncbi:MAG: auxin efflux carrier family protein, partial [Halanaerobium sp. T82-1]